MHALKGQLHFRRRKTPEPQRADERGTTLRIHKHSPGTVPAQAQSASALQPRFCPSTQEDVAGLAAHAETDRMPNVGDSMTTDYQCISTPCPK